jgi:hypothetical protein
MSEAMAPMPMYKSHKKVYALQIELIVHCLHGLRLFFRDAHFAPRVVAAELASRYIPEPGDYLVRYEDGYLAFSPKKAFEDGYTRVA